MEIEKGEIITLTDNRDYICLGIIVESDRKYLYLVTTSEPIQFCFAEETSVNGVTRMRIVGGRDEKQRLFALLKAKSQANSNRGIQHE